MNSAELLQLSTLGVAFIAGLLSFLSPCIAPILPGYIAFITGTATSKAIEISRSLMFVLGFTIIFSLLGMSAGSTRALIGVSEDVMLLISGLIFATLGLYFISKARGKAGSFTAFNRLSTKLQQKVKKPVSGFGALIFGSVCALVWTPCVGPFLASVLTMASGQTNSLWGGTLLASYSLGLGVPFIVSTVALNKVLKRSRKLRNYLKTMQLVAGIILLIIAALIVSGQFTKINVYLSQFFWF